MAARREGDDLLARCISLLVEVKDLIEAPKMRAVEPKVSTSSLVLQVQVQERPESHAGCSVAIWTV